MSRISALEKTNYPEIKIFLKKNVWLSYLSFGNEQDVSTNIGYKQKKGY